MRSRFYACVKPFQKTAALATQVVVTGSIVRFRTPYKESVANYSSRYRKLSLLTHRASEYALSTA